MVVHQVLKDFVVPELAPGSGSGTAEAVVAENTPMPPPPQFDAPQFLDFTSSVLEALNSNAINLATMEMKPTDFSAPPTGPEEPSDGSLPSDVIQKQDTGPAQPAEGNLQGSSLGHVADSQSLTALEAQLLEAVTAELSMNCPQNLLTDSYISNEPPSEPRYVSFPLWSLPWPGWWQKTLNRHICHIGVALMWGVHIIVFIRWSVYFYFTLYDAWILISLMSENFLLVHCFVISLL